MVVFLRAIIQHKLNLLKSCFSLPRVFTERGNYTRVGFGRKRLPRTIALRLIVLVVEWMTAAVRGSAFMPR